MSPSDLKHLETPGWIDPSKGEPTFMLFSVVDDRSGVSYMEYRCVYTYCMSRRNFYGGTQLQV